MWDECLFQLGKQVAGFKQFDRNEPLDRAMARFWTRGYEATSIDDLVAATRNRARKPLRHLRR
jgi:hypothetical protein